MLAALDPNVGTKPKKRPEREAGQLLRSWEVHDYSRSTAQASYSAFRRDTL